MFKDKLWIMGGTEDYYFGDASSLKNDVWCSADGATWECVNRCARRGSLSLSLRARACV